MGVPAHAANRLVAASTVSYSSMLLPLYHPLVTVITQTAAHPSHVTHSCCALGAE